MKTLKILSLPIFLIFFILSLFFCQIKVFAQEILVGEDRLEGIVKTVIEEREVNIMDKNQLYQRLEILIEKGVLKGEVIEVENGNFPMVSIPKYQIGDKLVLSMSKDLQGNQFIQITDYIRTTPLYWLLGIFIFLTLVIARLKGFTSILGLGFSFLVIFVFILPRILSGNDPVLVSILGSLLIVPVSFHLSHGLNIKTVVAIAGTLIALLITGILSNLFVELTHLSGFVSEEAGFLQLAKGELISIKGLLLAGIIIGVLGVLDDVTVSQAAVVEQLKKANDKLNRKELYQRAMGVGRDHIASMVNTLVLVYTGASLPLLLLFIDSPHPVTEVINYEIVANEIIRTLVGSIGLILAVPITTYLAVLIMKKAPVNHEAV